MQGLKTQESLKFERFFRLIQNEAQNNKSVFFAFAGDGRDFETQDMEGEDMMGWLIPQSSALAFQNEWEADNSEEALKQWSKFFTWAEWKEKNGKISIEFNSHDE